MVPDGFLLVDKPGGWTSHDVVAKVRTLTGMRRVGHAGTLDPMATGLLVLGLGRATRLLRFVQGQRKVYAAVARFGVATDTLDAEGTETARVPMKLDRTAVAATLAGFVGDISQVPPMTSAIKVGGRKLYELAREGRDVERKPRPVTIHELELVSFTPGDFPLVGLHIVCSSGTYVRSLADDVAQSLGGRAHLVELRRIAIGSLNVSAARTIDDYAADPDLLTDELLAPASGLADLPRIQVGTAIAERVRHGAKVPRHELPVEASTAVVDADGRFLAVYRPDDEIARAEVVIG